MTNLKQHSAKEVLERLTNDQPLSKSEIKEFGIDTSEQVMGFWQEHFVYCHYTSPKSGPSTLFDHVEEEDSPTQTHTKSQVESLHKTNIEEQVEQLFKSMDEEQPLAKNVNESSESMHQADTENFQYALNHYQNENGQSMPNQSNDSKQSYQTYPQPDLTNRYDPQEQSDLYRNDRTKHFQSQESFGSSSTYYQPSHPSYNSFPKQDLYNQYNHSQYNPYHSQYSQNQYYQPPDYSTPETRVFLCNVYGCGRKYQTISGFKHHIKTGHRPVDWKDGEKLVYSCQACDKTFTTKAGLIYHKKSVKKHDPIDLCEHYLVDKDL